MREKLPPFPSHIKVTTINDWPYSKIVDMNGTLMGKGACFELLEEFMKKFNFTYNIVPPDSNVIGDPNTGMVKQLYNKEVDMAVSFIPLIGELRKYVEFSEPIDNMDTTFLIPRPGTSATGTGLFAPFSDRVWWAILISIFIIGPAIYVLIYLRSRFADTEGGEKFTFYMSLWFAYGALLKQGTINAPIGDSVRMAFAGWWLFIIIISAYYTANLTAFLTLNKFTLWINSLTDLYYWRYNWWIIDGRSIAALIDYDDPSVDPLIKMKNNWGYGYLSSDHNMTYANMLKHADNRVYIVDRTLAMLAIQEDYVNRSRENIPDNYRCRYAISDHNVFEKLRGFAFPKGSIIKKYFNYDMMVSFENGFISHYRATKTASSQVCPLDITMIERQLKISDLAVTYKTCAYAYAWAVGLLGLEVIWWLMLKLFKKGRSRFKIGEINNTAPPANNKIYDDKCNEATIRQGWSPPPPYETSEKTMSIQGKEYDVVRQEITGDRRLIPARSTLFQYLH